MAQMVFDLKVFYVKNLNLLFLFDLKIITFWYHYSNEKY